MGIAQPTHLDWRRFVGEYRKAVLRHMARQIYQDVDAIVSDSLGQGGIGHPNRHAPVVRESLEALCHRIRPTHLRVAKQLDLSSVMMLQQRFQVTRHRMPPEIRGYIADLQPQLWGGVASARQ